MHMQQAVVCRSTYIFPAGAGGPQRGCPQDILIVPPVARWTWPSRSRERNLTCQCPAGWGTRWQVEDDTQRLAGGDLGDRAKQPSALSRTLSRALDATVPTVVAGQVKPTRTTVEQPQTSSDPTASPTAATPILPTACAAETCVGPRAPPRSARARSRRSFAAPTS